MLNIKAPTLKKSRQQHLLVSLLFNSDFDSLENISISEQLKTKTVGKLAVSLLGASRAESKSIHTWDILFRGVLLWLLYETVVLKVGLEYWNKASFISVSWLRNNPNKTNFSIPELLQFQLSSYSYIATETYLINLINKFGKRLPFKDTTYKINRTKEVQSFHMQI